uniref:Uncharacterized protein n=1 Tax=Arundo donax TaxID=35708 RepID=A0A0A8ZRS8_ARUDO
MIITIRFKQCAICNNVLSLT